MILSLCVLLGGNALVGGRTTGNWRTDPSMWHTSPRDWKNSPSEAENSSSNRKNSTHDSKSGKAIRDTNGNAAGYATPKAGEGRNPDDSKNNRTGCSQE